MKKLIEILIAIALLGTPALQAQDVTQPWKEPQDTVKALFNPDEYAWRLFVALNWPADTAKQEADQNKAFGSTGPVTWETWRNVRNNAPNSVFPLDGSDPGEWLTTPVQIARAESEFDAEPRQKATVGGLVSISRDDGKRVAFDVESPGSEVRMNKSAYEFVRSKDLYNSNGQIALAQSGPSSLNFPPNSKEIKALWKVIREQDKARYHWTEVTRNNGTKEIWGLATLHVLTKDIPNWFWATYEHVDNKTEGPGWIPASVDRFACPQAPHDCEKAPSGIGIEGTVWENYRLRGTQVDFIDAFGNPTRLSNSLIEGANLNSSCITCHSLAATDDGGNILSFAFIVGPPQPSWFQPQPPATKMMKFDFVWSLARARPKQ